MRSWMRLIVIVTAIAAAAAFADHAMAQECALVDPLGSATVGPDQASYDFVVPYTEAGECYWKPSGTSASWLSVGAYSWTAGLTDDEVTYKVSENTGFTRTGEVVLEGTYAYTVTQAGRCNVGFVAPPSAVDAVFVAYPACGSIVRVGQTGAVPIYADPPSDGYPGSSYEGLVHGPDGFLYGLDPIRGHIDVFDPAVTEPAAPVGSVYDRDDPDTTHSFSPRFGRFNLNGDLIVSDGNSLAVYKFPKAYPYDLADPGNQLGDPILVYESADGKAAGVTFDADGTLLVVHSTTDMTSDNVLRFEDEFGIGEYSGPAGTPISVPEGSLGIGRAANRDVFVAAGETLDWTGGAECASFAGAALLDVDPSANDTFHVTMLTTNAQQQSEVQLWELPFGYDPCDFAFFCAANGPDSGDTRLLATFAVPQGAPATVSGVALPFSGRQAYVPDVPPVCPYEGQPVQGSKPVDGGEGWNFFDLYATFNPIPEAGGESCTVAISSQEYSPIDIEAVINDPDNALSPSRPLVLPGDNGRMRVLTYTPLSSCPSGGANGDPLYERGVSAFFSRVNPKLALCHADELTQCNLQRLKTLDLEFGFIPEDGNLSGFDPRFSEGFLVDQVPPGGLYDGVWCGVDEPVNDEPPWLEANAGSVVPIDIKPVLKGAQCGDKTIPDLVAVLNIWNADTGTELPFEDLNFTGSGSAEPLRAVFYEGSNPKKPYSLNWDTNDRDGNPLPKGLYKLNIIDDTAATRGILKIYFAPKTVYVILK